MVFKIKYHKDMCIGCGNCVAVCSENWELIGNKAKPKKLTLKKLGCNKEAEESCPVDAIEIEEK